MSYTTEILLEAIPAFFSAFAIWSYVHYQKIGRRRWFYLCAVAIGITAASKYIYVVAAFAILPFLLWEHRKHPWQIALFGIISLGSFILFNPILWPDPVQRLIASLQFHLNYSQGTRVARAARPWWWELGYLAVGETFVRGQPAFSVNTIIFILGWLGLPQLARKSRVYLLWFIVALLFLLIWPTKWQQYALVFVTPMCLSAGLAVQAAIVWCGQNSTRVQQRILRL